MPSLSQTTPAHLTLQTLTPVTLLPERYIERPESVTALQRIDPIVSCEPLQRSGCRQSIFSLSVYFKLSRRRIPVLFSRGLTLRNGRPQSFGTSTNPDIRVEHTFTEFRRLRDAVYDAANSDHGLAACSYCRAVNDLVLLGASTPHKSMQLLQKPEVLAAALAHFLQDLLQLAVQTKPSRFGQPCCGQQRIPELVCDFLQVLKPSIREAETATNASAPV